MFKDLQTGYTISVLDKSGEVPQYKTGTVAKVSQPRYNMPPNGQLPQFPTEKVIDLTVEIDGKTNTYIVNEMYNIASTPILTLACDPSLIANEVKAMMKHHQDEIDKFSLHEKSVAACEKILASLDKGYAESKENSQRIEKIESSIADLGKSLAEIKSILAVPKSQKQ